MMPLLQNPIACGAILLLSFFSFWIINASASRSFPCTFRKLGFFQSCLSFFDAYVWKPSEPTPAQAPPIPQEEKEESVAPVTACGTVDPNSLPSDVWSMCLKGLDLASLVKLETAVAKTLPASLGSAFSDAWDVQEARVDPDERVEGATARDRAIGSCLPYRRQLMKQFVQKVWTTGPTGNEMVLDIQALTSGDYDVYMAFSRPARSGCRRIFLAGDFVESDDVVVYDDSDGLPDAFFEFSSFDLTKWPLLRHFASSDGDTYIQRYNDERGVLGGDVKDALGEVEVTVVAIHHTTLTPSVLFTSDNGNAMNGLILGTYGANSHLFDVFPRCWRCRDAFCRAGSMDTSACDGVETMRYVTFIVTGIEDESSATLAVRLKVRQNFGRCCRPWWLNNVLVFFMLCLICVYNVNFWLNHDLHATSVEFSF